MNFGRELNFELGCGELRQIRCAFACGRHVSNLSHRWLCFAAGCAAAAAAAASCTATAAAAAAAANATAYTTSAPTAGGTAPSGTAASAATTRTADAAATDAAPATSAAAAVTAAGDAAGHGPAHSSASAVDTDAACRPRAARLPDKFTCALRTLWHTASRGSCKCRQDCK